MEIELRAPEKSKTCDISDIPKNLNTIRDQQVYIVTYKPKGKKTDLKLH